MDTHNNEAPSPDEAIEAAEICGDHVTDEVCGPVGLSGATADQLWALITLSGWIEDGCPDVAFPEQAPDAADIPQELAIIRGMLCCLDPEDEESADFHAAVLSWQDTCRAAIG